MAQDMAPPSKRRKLSKGWLQRIFSPDNAVTISEPTPTWPHTIESITPTRLQSSSTPTKIHVEIRERPTYPLQVIAPAQLQPRQLDTLSAGVSVSVGLTTSDGSVTETTSTATSSDANPTAGSSSSTTQSSSSLSASDDSVSSTTTAEDTSSTDTTSNLTASSSVTDSPTSSGSSSAANSEGDSSSSSIASESNSSTVVASTSTTPTSLTSTLPSGNSTALLTSSSNGSGVSIAAATIASSGSNSTASISHTSFHSSSTGAGAIFLSTDSNGEVSTLTRSSSSSSPSSTSFSSSHVTSPSSHTSSGGRTTTNSRGSSVIIYQTVSASDDGNGNSQQYTYYSTEVIGAASIAASSTSPSSSTGPSVAKGSGDGNDDAPPASTVAGGVVGGVAGLAFIVLLAMLLLRWQRRKGSAQQQALAGPGSASAIGSVEDDQPRGPSGPGMAERAGLMPIMNAVPGMFRHQNRSTEASTSEPSERGFTRVSGRKLPSAFSEGMTGPPPPPLAMPIPASYAQTNPSTSNIDESDPFMDQSDTSPTDARFGGVGAAGMVPVPSSHRTRGEQLQMSPGPARKPTVHHGGPYNFTPSTSTFTSPRSTARGSDGFSSSSPPHSATAFLRSETPVSVVDSRGSRFMEEV